MRKRTFICMVLSLFFFMLVAALVKAEDEEKCDGSTCPVDPDVDYGGGIECSDSDADPETKSDLNLNKWGICSDYAAPNGHEPGDYCFGIAYLEEWYCYQCSQRFCNIRENICEYGCNKDKGRCNTKEELLGQTTLPTSGHWCVDGDGQDIPDPFGQEPIALFSGGCDDNGNNGRTNYDEDSFCIDYNGKFYFDHCDGGNLVDYYCNDAATCMPQYRRCDCTAGKCAPEKPKEGYCFNPDSDSCDREKTFNNICCPSGDKNYPVENGPSTYENCMDEYFKTEVSALDWDKCEIIPCCCEIYYDDENKKQVDIKINVYAMLCAGTDKVQLKDSKCSLQDCQSLSQFASLPTTINAFENRWLDDIKEGRGCKAGICAKDLICVDDLNIDGEKVCCKNTNCVNNGVCVPENTEAIKGSGSKKYICQASKWNAVSDPGDTNNCGCFGLRCAKSKNSDAALVFAPLAFILFYFSRKGLRQNIK